MQQDPAEDGYNWYVYGNQNPVMYVDYTGENSVAIFNNSWQLGKEIASSDGPQLYADIVGLVVGVSGTVAAGSVWIYEKATAYFEAEKAKSITTAASTLKKDNPDATIIYRTGSGNATNLTPREKDLTGLSYTTIMPVSGAFTMTTLEAVNATGVLSAVVDGGTHVSVKATNDAKMQEWIDSRTFALLNPHEYTLLLQGISIKIK